MILEPEKLEPLRLAVDTSIGVGIVNACVNLGLLDKAHSIPHEMNAPSCFVGLGIYVPIPKAYCKEQ